MKAREQTAYVFLGFTSNFSDAGLAAINLPKALSRSVKLAADLGQKYFDIEKPLIVKSLNLYSGLRLISLPIVALQGTHKALYACARGDRVGFIRHAITSVIAVIDTFKVALVMESIALGAIHSASMAFKGFSITTVLFSVKTLVLKYELFLLYAQVWMCKDQKARANFLNTLANQDDHPTKSLDKALKENGPLKRLIRSKGIKYLEYNQLDALDSQLKWDFCIQAANVGLIAATLGIGMLSSYNLISEQMLMLLDVGKDITSVINQMNLVKGSAQSLMGLVKAYDRYLAILSASIVTALTLAIAVAYPSTESIGILTTLFLLSIASVAYIYSKDVKPELKYDFSRLPELSSLGERASTKHDSCLPKRSRSVSI